MPNLGIADCSFQLKVFTLADAAKETIREQSAAIFDLFLEREAEFSVHGSVEIDYPDLSDFSESGFLADAATYATRRAASMAEGISAVRVVGFCRVACA